MLRTTLAGREAPRAARRAVVDCCSQAGTGPVCAESTELMTSEVVTNGVLYGGGQISLGVNCEGPRVRVEVGDENPNGPLIREGEHHAEGGRGLSIVENLAAAWGVARTPTGKIVWFEVPATP